ncbi:MAG: VanW family protein [Lachnospiraceae bacterium]
MKIKTGRFLTILAVMFLGLCMTTQAASSRSLEAPNGVTIEGVNVSGMSEDEIEVWLTEYMKELANTEIIFDYDGITSYTYMPSEFALTWTNTDIIDEIFTYGTQGNVIERYKALKDLEIEGVAYTLEFSLDEEAIMLALTDIATAYDMEAENYHLTRVNGEFSVVEGLTGYAMNITASCDAIMSYLSREWDREPATIALVVEVTEPLGSQSELSSVQDVLGTFSSSAATSSSSRVGNITNGASLINGVTVYPGEEFDFQSFCSPYTIANGYYVGQAYSGGQVVDSIGGGICQVSSTLYNAVLRAELEVTMRYNHSMIVSYVPISTDATLAESAGKSFKFVNNLDTPIYIEAYVTSGKQIYVTIYGEEYRDENRTIEYISETLEVISPGAEIIYTDASLPIGYVDVNSAYTGYKSQLVKVVKIDGVEQSREVVNTSNYSAVARSATFGTATDDPVKLEHLNAAISTGSIDHTINIMNTVLTWTTEEVTE